MLPDHPVIRRNHVTELPGPGPTLLYAHGFGCNQTMWQRVVPAFRQSHRQVLFDYVGSGRSDWSAFDTGKYATLAGYAQDLIDIGDALSLEGAVFVGHSVSCSIGMLAMHCATTAVQQDDPDRPVAVLPEPPARLSGRV
jgi:sigma-B regulation protein RsbQ